MTTRSPVVAILIATLWISASEFFRNQVLFTNLWVEHYKSLGLTFPAAPVNGFMWGVWSLVFASLTYAIAQRFSVWHTTLLAWTAGFVLMWLVIGNLDVLPVKLLVGAVPLSLLEAFVTAWIVKRLS